MISALTYASVAILLGWVAYATTGLVISSTIALIIGAAVGGLAVLVFRDTIVVRGVIAVLGPIGIVLPLLALRHVAAGLGVTVAPFGTLELLVFVLVYMGFIATSMGVIPLDIYRLGYAPLPVGVMVLAMCLYGALTGSLNVLDPVFEGVFETGRFNAWRIGKNTIAGLSAHQLSPDRG